MTTKGVPTMLTVGDRFPEFALQAAVSLEKGKEFQEITSMSALGRWKVVFFWPMDFTFICPTEIAEFGKRNRDFEDRDAVVLGASTDTHFVHLAWRRNHDDRSRCSPTPSGSWRRRSASCTSRTAWRCGRRSSSTPKGSSGT
jgi:peroxiredoxin (alkyl hydroperoxide reductase subunit C)